MEVDIFMENWLSLATSHDGYLLPLVLETEYLFPSLAEEHG